MIAIKPQALIYLLVILLISACAHRKSKDPETHIVKIEQMSFVPEKLTVSPGDTVKWINRDVVTHDVKSKHWDSPKMEQGESYSVVISSNTNYKCTLHPVMKGEIIITNNN